MRVGIPYITISPHNSGPVIAHLADKVQSGYIIHSCEPPLVKLVESASQIILRDASRTVVSIQMPKFEDIFRPGTYPNLNDRHHDLDATAIYTHSSGTYSLSVIFVQLALNSSRANFLGSTSFPKPIPWSHAFLLQSAVAPRSQFHLGRLLLLTGSYSVFGSYNFCNEVFACHAVSMSHGSGVHLLPFVASPLK